MNNYYRILGVKSTATNDEIKKTYRELAKQFHPDKNPNNKEAEENFKAISEAYEHLSNVEKRKAFDLKLQLEEQRLRQEKVNSQRTTYSNNPINWGHFVTVVVILILVVVGLTSFANISNRGKR